MNIRDKVLLVEDERTIRSFMQAILTANGYDVLMAGTGAMANTMIASHCPDIIILDLGLPDMDGMTILRNVRKWSKVPILVVSARSHERDKVEALDAGADDYLTKPFSLMELASRCRALLRRGGMVKQASDVLTVGDIVLSPSHREVTVVGEPLKLTLREFDLLEYLMRNAGRVLTRGQLIDRIWGSDYVGDTKTLDVHVKRLRTKIEKEPSRPEQLITVRGLGYKFEP